MMLLSFILITILAGWWFSTIELPAGFSSLKATGVVGGRYLGLIILLSILVGGCLFSGAFVRALNHDVSLTAPGASLIIVISASLAVLLNFKLSKFTSIAYALMGALIGWSIFNKGQLDFALIAKYILIWLSAPVLAGLIASLLYRIYRFFIHKSKIHLLVLIPYLRWGLLFVAVVFAVLIGVNNGALLILLNQPVVSGFGFSWNELRVGEEYVFFIISVILIGLLTWNKASEKMNGMSEGRFDVNIEFILIALAAGSIVLFLFSVPAITGAIRLPVTPLSIGGIVIGGLFGINMARGNNGTAYTEEFRMMLSALTTPLSACLLALFTFNIVDVKTLLSRNIEGTIGPSREAINISPVITTLVITLFFILVVLYLKKQQQRKTRAEIISLENQNRLFENQRALTELEVKTVVIENENLNTKLELRRKELINIALSISEQKKFEEKIYGEIKSLREKDDIDELKKGIGGIEKQLLHKMNYSQELKSFYAQVESVHKDFNLRLTEKFPKLTEQERTLITLLRLDFSSKHIATLMNIAPKSVEISRHRLRTKMGLSRNDNLIQFINSI